MIHTEASMVHMENGMLNMKLSHFNIENGNARIEEKIPAQVRRDFCMIDRLNPVKYQ